MEEVRFDREYSQEPRTLSELLEAEHKLSKELWYNRHWNLRNAIDRGKHKLVMREEWQKAPLKRKHRMTIDSVWEGALAAARRAEEELARIIHQRDDKGWPAF